jgi:excinuclease ABC subunit C
MLPRVPQRIEVYDNSHIRGSNPVGAMIVAGPEGFRKNQYRKFNIRSTDLAPGDDYGMMREVLTRRFKRLLADARRGVPGDVVAEPGSGPEAPIAAGRVGGEVAGRESTDVVEAADTVAEGMARAPDPGLAQDIETAESPWPDLGLIDGGAGQLAAARETLTRLGVAVPLVAVAKGPDRDAGHETFHMPDREAFRLPPRDPVLYFVERLRDEAHRFAVGSHRQRRRRDIREAGLQEIPGIGPTRKRALLRHFGTLKAIERASLSDLAEVSGINAETARRIYDYFHESGR